MAKSYDFLIRGGLVVSGTRIRKADIGIEGEKIASVEPELLSENARRVIDASGKYVIPGVIDVHIHPVYEEDLGGTSLGSLWRNNHSAPFCLYQARNETPRYDKKISGRGGQEILS